MFNRLRQKQKLAFPSLHYPVEIIRDTWGVPHIYAKTETDLFFAQGFVHAQDRLFQMDLNRRVGSGRLSEIIGSKGVATDRFARIMGWTRAAHNHVHGGDDATLVMADAYCAGINAFISSSKVPLEFRLLFYKPEPWHLYHSAAWGIVLAWGLSANWQSELIRNLLIAALGEEKAADILPMTDAATPSTNPITAQLAANLLTAYEEAVAALPLGKLPVGQNIGSNNWVVAPERMSTKRPLLANDPHLPPIFPSIWYENHLVGGRYNVTGFSTPGVPGVLIGHNDHIAWGITNAFTDIQDIYIERFHPQDSLRYEQNGRWHNAEQVNETIHIRGSKPLTVPVRYTHHGPIITDLLYNEERDLSLCWMCHQPNNHLSSALKLNRATDWDSFNEALRDWAFPPQNMVYADTAGHTGYTLPGQIPLRQQGNGMTPAPGWDGCYDWQGQIPHEELLRTLNPPSGVIATANNRVIDNSYPHWLTEEWLPPYRAARILQLLQTPQPLSLADHLAVQQDTVSLLARRFLPLVLPHLAKQQLDGDLARGRELLRQWDGNMAVDSVAPTLYFGWLVHLTRAAMTQALGEAVCEQLLSQTAVSQSPGNPFQAIAYERLLDWLETQPPDWVSQIVPHIFPSYVKTFAVLRQSFGPKWKAWEWGKLHRLHVKHPLTAVPGLGKYWRPQAIPMPGSANTINQTAVPPQFPPEPVEMIASCRMVLDVGAWDNSVVALPGGQSAYVNSLHYQDGLEGWKNGRYRPMLFSRSRIEAAAKATTWLNPTK